MNEETFKIIVRAYFPEASFLNTVISGGIRCIEVSLPQGWFHTVHWEADRAYKCVDTPIEKPSRGTHTVHWVKGRAYKYVDTPIGEKSLCKYLRTVKRTGQLYDPSRGIIPLDAYGERNIKYFQAFCEQCKGD